MTELVHTAAVVLIPPEPVREPIQAIRRVHDRQGKRWMPHITLLYPFWAEARFVEAVPRLEAACAEIAPFAVTLARFRHFAHGARRFTVWLDPGPRAPLVGIQAALEAAFPECRAQSRFPAGFTPHLSVGQVRDRAGLERLLDRLQTEWKPMSFEADRIVLITRDGHGPFRPVRDIRLGGGTAGS
jgi:2'-5' RNA ligase